MWPKSTLRLITTLMGLINRNGSLESFEKNISTEIVPIFKKANTNNRTVIIEEALTQTAVLPTLREARLGFFSLVQILFVLHLG